MAEVDDITKKNQYYITSRQDSANAQKIVINKGPLFSKKFFTTKNFKYIIEDASIKRYKYFFIFVEEFKSRHYSLKIYLLIYFLSHLLFK